MLEYAGNLTEYRSPPEPASDADGLQHRGQIHGSHSTGHGMWQPTTMRRRSAERGREEGREQAPETLYKIETIGAYRTQLVEFERKPWAMASRAEAMIYRPAPRRRLRRRASPPN